MSGFRAPVVRRTRKVLPGCVERTRGGLGANRGPLGLAAHRGQHPRRLDKIDVAHEIMRRIDTVGIYIPILEIRRQALDVWSGGLLYMSTTKLNIVLGHRRVLLIQVVTAYICSGLLRGKSRMPEDRR